MSVEYCNRCQMFHPDAHECEAAMPLDIYERQDGSFYLGIPRREGQEQYAITWNDVHRLLGTASDILRKR